MLTRLLSTTLATAALSLSATSPAIATPSPLASREPRLISQAASRSQQLNTLLEQGRELADAGDYGRALTVYQQAAQLASDNARIFSGIGYLQARQRNFTAAVAAYQRAIAWK
ncbi:MAG: tetratricopeptide repeat protein [Spirulinaceae cyanobacterium RM2_2_10]|nr:tetratricopeptide repeat protein [Spirulinaceae cyanobacterium RM2_2_10]